jgi:hypothetical protein
METINKKEQGIPGCQTPSNTSIIRIAYLLFMMLGFYNLGRRDWNNAGLYFVFSLVFDPFNQNIKWDDRPPYQRIWLYVQVVASLFLFFM